MAIIETKIRWATNADELKSNLKSGLDQIEAMKASADRLTKSMSGDGLFRAANNLTAAIDQLGGVTKLTAGEQDKASATLDKAIAKYQAMGATAPSAMIQTRDALKAATEATTGWLPMLQAMGNSWVARIAEGVLLRDAVHLLLGELKNLAMALPEIALKGATVSDVSENFQRLTADAGMLGQTLLGTLRTGTHSTIDDFELMKTVNKDLAAGLKLTDAQFSTLSKGAFALAQATGVSVKDALETMNDALLTGRTRALALLTGKIDTTKAEEDYAKSLGKSADQLSDAGKLEAARVAILKSVGDATKRLGEQTDGLDERVDQAKAAWANFTDELGRTIAESPVIMAALDGIRDEVTKAFGSKQQDLVVAIAHKIDQAAIAAVGFAQTGVTVGAALVKEWYAVNKVIGDLAQIVEGDALAFEYLSLGVAKTAAQLTIGDAAKKYAADVERIQGNIDSLLVSMSKRGAALQADEQAQAGVDASAAKFSTILADLQQRMEKAAATSATSTAATTAAGAAHTMTAAEAAAHAASLVKLDQADKEYGEALTRVTSIMSTAYQTMLTIDGNTVEGIKYYLQRGASVDDLAKMYGLLKPQIEAVHQVMKFEQSVLDATTKAFKDQHAIIGLMVPRYSALHDELTGIDHETGNLAATLIDSGTAMFSFTNQMEDNARKTDIGRDALEHYRTTMQKLGDGAKSSLGGLNNIFERAFEGGGGVGGAVSSFATNITSNLLSAIPVVGPIVSQFAGAIVSGVKKLFGGPSQDELAARDTFAKFQQQYGSLEQTIAAVGKAYEKAGKTGVDAQRDLQRALDATHISAQAEADALATINGVINEGKKDQDDLNAAIAKYGFTINELGPAMQKQQLDAQAQQLVKDWTLLVQSGIDVSTVNTRMSSSMNDYLKLARQTGQEVPQAMQPILQKMIDQGVLTDDNGKKITDLSQIGVKFSMSMSDGFKLIADKLQTLLEKLGLVPKALEAIPDEKTIDINYVTHGNPNGDGGPVDHTVETNSGGGGGKDYATLLDEWYALPDDFRMSTTFDDWKHSLGYASLGGMVSALGIQYKSLGGPILPFIPKGTDTVPAMLTPGEEVLSVGEAANYRAGRGGADVSVLEEYRKQGRMLERTTRYLTQDLAKDLATSVRDQAQGVRRRR